MDFRFQTGGNNFMNGNSPFINPVAAVTSPIRNFFGSLFALVLGPVFIVAGFWIHGMMQPYADGTMTTGTVTGVEQSRNSDGNLMYSPVVTFTDGDGRTHEIRSSMSSSSQPTIGTSKSVSYQAADPDAARVIDGSSSWFGWLFVGVGALVFLGGIFGLLKVVLVLGLGAFLLTRLKSGGSPAPAPSSSGAETVGSEPDLPAWRNERAS